MSYDFNYKFWVATADQIRNVLLRERVYQQLKPTQDETAAHTVFASLFARYVSLVNRLSDIYDQTCQVQKRNLVRRLLETATKRLLELKAELKKIELSEFIYIDKVLVQEKLSPDDIQLLSPFHFPQRRQQEIQELIDGKRSAKEERVEPTATERKKPVKKSHRFSTVLEDTPEIVLSAEQRRIINAVNLLKTHERARRSRIWYRNILADPEVYKPKPSIVKTIQYNFTFRPGQPMLIPVKKLEYSSNFYVEKKSFDGVQYYVRPTHRKMRIVGASSLPDDTSFKTKTVSETSFKFLADQDPKLTESYFTGGLEGDQLPTNSLPTTLEPLEMPCSELSSLASSTNLKHETAASVIQRYWKSYKVRKRLRKRLLNKLKLIGMIDERRWQTIDDPDFQSYREKQRARKELFDREFAQICEDEKIRILKLKSPWIMEDISEHVRAWFKEFYEECQNFHPYPEELKGGTIILMRSETMDPQEYKEHLKKQKDKKKLAAEKKKEDEKKKAEAEKQKAKKEKEKIQAKMKKALEATQGKTYDFASEEFVTKNFLEMDKTITEYDCIWPSVDEKNNLYEAPYMDWITGDAKAEVHLELHPVVDELMRIEYELLRKALAKDQKKKYKAEKAKKGRKGKKGKGKKGKKVPKDMTADRSLESLFFELEESGLILKTEKLSLDDYIGDYNYAAFEQRNTFLSDPPASKGEVKQVLRQWILGLGPLNLPKPKSILIAGPASSGKKYLAKALATEIGAVIIDISPENVLQFSDNMKYFIHLVSKMARLLQPTVLFINEAHRVFYKKVPGPEAEVKPKLLAKHLIKKILKPIKKDEKIILIGTSSQPWLGKVGKMKKSFERTMLLPRTDYGTGYLVWRNGMLNKCGVPRDFELSPLAMVTKGYPSSLLYNNIEHVLNIRRRMKLPIAGLTESELLEGLLQGPEPLFPTTTEEYDKFLKWFKKTDKLTKKRDKKLKAVAALNERKHAMKK